MKKIILGLITVFTITSTFSQQLEEIEHCNCQIKIDQIAPLLNGQFKQLCNDELVEKGSFINGEKDDLWVTYSRKGTLIREVTYNNGLLDGVIKLYHTNGKPKLIGQFDKGNKVGKWTYYTIKGKTLSEGNYNLNKPIGIWTINDRKGKKAMIQYDYTLNKYLTKSPAPYHKDGKIIRNENTEEFYILKSPEKTYSSKSEPLGGYSFANYMFIELVEVPENFWDTYLYNKYKVTFNVNEDNSMTFNSRLHENDIAKDSPEITFIIVTNNTPKIKRVEHSDLEVQLLDFKIKEGLSFLPPWIYNDQSEVVVDLHYVINENMHKN